MSQLSGANPLGNLSTGLNFQPGGNPYSALAQGGVAGLGAAYGQSYNSALAANQQNYNNVIGGYQSLAGNIGNILGQGGTPWGVAGPAAQAIQDTQAQQTGGAIQNSINSGVGKSTAAVAAQRGANLDASKAYASLGSQLAQSYAGYTASLGQGMLGAEQAVNIPFPNAGQYNQLYQQYGQQQQSQQNMAYLAQQQQLQQQMARRVAPNAPGGASPTPQMPRGGTYGSGGGGFPSGSGVTPTGFGLPSSTFGYGGGSAAGGGSGYQEYNLPNMASGYGAGSPDLQTGSGTFDPSDPYGAVGDFGAGFGGDFGGIA